VILRRVVVAGTIGSLAKRQCGRRCVNRTNDPNRRHDSIVYLGRLDRQRERFGFDVAAVGLDAGYATSGIAQGLEQRGILGVTGYRRPTPPRPGMIATKMFTYEAAVDGYRCPQRLTARLCHHRPQRLPPLQERSGDLQNLPAGGFMHIEPQRHPPDHP
jgi:hypothetical protein